MLCSHCNRERKIVARGFCAACYERWRKTGSLEYQRLGRVAQCEIHGCMGTGVSSGLCSKHRARMERHGTTDDPPQWGAKIRHPLKHTWKWILRHRGVRGVSPVWEKDFLQFAMDVGERPSPKHKLFAADDSRPIGPDNFVWKRAITERAPNEDARTYEARRDRVYRRVKSEEAKGYVLKKIYGLTVAQYEKLSLDQGGVCAICLRPEQAKSAAQNGVTRNLAIDHCHASGRVRGLLCSACNTILGLAGDDIDRLRAAIAYLERHTEK